MLRLEMTSMLKDTVREISLGEPLDVRDVAKIVGCSVWNIKNRCLKAGLPHLRFGANGKLLFFQRQVVKWIIDQQRSIDELEQNGRAD